MNIDWGAFGLVAVVAFGASVAVVVLFSLAVVALGYRSTAAGRGVGGISAVLCFAACAAVVGYGIYLIATG